MLSDANASAETPISLPALRGTFGDWTYYSAVVPLSELAARVSFADEIHTNKSLSELIQRSLRGGRAEEIAAYLVEQPERFFNSLVIAVYGGAPQWVRLKVQTTKEEGPELGNTTESLGVLELTGKESLFAVDGQHRLAGMKRLLKQSTEQVGDAPAAALTDLVSVLFIAHRTDKIERTRRLFTTLNKTAVPVSKMERIALDENDVMAITARRLVQDHVGFREPRVAMHHTNNLKKSEDIALTTIGNLYDVLCILFLSTSGRKKKELEFNRPDDAGLNGFFQTANDFFSTLAEVEPGLGEYFAAAHPQQVCQNYRTASGGSVFFRPLGLALMTDVAMCLRATEPSTWKRWLAVLPRQLAEAPFAGTIWSRRNTIEPKNRVLCRNVLLHMCGAYTGSMPELAAKYKELAGEELDLPRRLELISAPHWPVPLDLGTRSGG